MDKKIRYIVHLKDNFSMPNTVIKRIFCASLEHIDTESYYFKIHGCGGYVQIPHKGVLWMAPSKVLFEKGYKEERL